MARNLLKKTKLFFHDGYLFLYWFLCKPAYRGAKAVIVCGDEMLLIRHTFQPHHWTFAGGTLEVGEQPIDAVIRELKEELNLTVKKEDLVFIGVFDNVQLWKRGQVSCFSLKVSTKDCEIDGVELAEARWFPINEPPKNLGRKNARKILALYQNSL